MVIAALVLAAYVVPYTVLSDVKAWYGSFLFWVLFALAAIAVVTWLTRSWGATADEPETPRADEGRDEP